MARELVGFEFRHQPGIVCQSSRSFCSCRKDFDSDKPTGTMMELLKRIMAQERPDLIDGKGLELKDAGTSAKFNAAQLSLRERELIAGLIKLWIKERETVYAVIKALLRVSRRKGTNGK